MVNQVIQLLIVEVILTLFDFKCFGAQFGGVKSFVDKRASVNENQNTNAHLKSNINLTP